jgi:ATP-binding cassette, subfamily G (WHITE), eye pigment precursor transporter
LDPDTAREKISYVLQEDAIMATSTVREVLTFSATLRLPGDTSQRSIDALVDSMIEQLKLKSCENTVVGSQLSRGISVMRERERAAWE